MLTIGEVAEQLHIPSSTLRYYDKEGLLPNLQRKNGIRYFSEQEIRALQIIDCLKQSGLDIKSIRQFMDWCNAGKDTYQQRLNLFEQQKEAVIKQIADLNDVLAILNFKCWYYREALKDGNEMRVRQYNKDNYSG